jgi:hypothetical protein
MAAFIATAAVRLNASKVGMAHPAMWSELVLQEAWDWRDRWTDVLTPVNIRTCLNCGAEEGYRDYWILPGGGVVKPAKQRREPA